MPEGRITITVNEKALEPEIAFGAGVVCDPALTPEDGDFIVYWPSSQESLPIFRRFIRKEDGNVLLKSQNRMYDSYVASESEMRKRGKIYVIVSATRFFRKQESVPLFGDTGKSDGYLTFDEAKTMLKVRRTMMYALLRGGELEASKAGRLWRIERSAVERYLASRSNKKASGADSKK